VFVTPRGYERQVQDPTHKWPPIVAGSYQYYDPRWLAANSLGHYVELLGLRADFEVKTVELLVDDAFAHEPEERKRFAVTHYANAAIDLSVRLVKR
jgi:hypothetical protein